MCRFDNNQIITLYNNMYIIYVNTNVINNNSFQNIPTKIMTSATIN